MIIFQQKKSSCINAFLHQLRKVSFILDSKQKLNKSLKNYENSDRGRNEDVKNSNLKKQKIAVKEKVEPLNESIEIF